MLDRSEPDGGEGLGAMAGTPQAKALAGMKMVQQGTQQIVLVIPALAQQLGDFLNQLQMVTVNAVAGMSQGGAPGMAPMPAPPPPMPQMPPPQAAPAPTPGIPGM